ncbi:MAG: hypothetical protein AAF916_12625 [Planctomycetota bacterium]
MLTTRYVVDEVERNLNKLPNDGRPHWATYEKKLLVVPDVFTVDRPVVFGAAKDRPILFSALAWADVLLTLDRGDFGGLLGSSFYGLPIATPGEFLRRVAADSS